MHGSIRKICFEWRLGHTSSSHSSRSTAFVRTRYHIYIGQAVQFSQEAKPVGFPSASNESNLSISVPVNVTCASHIPTILNVQVWFAGCTARLQL